MQQMIDNWTQLFDEVAGCDKCELCRARTYAVPGEGDPEARLMFVGEGPGADEDAQGRPFVGASGALLTAMLREIGIDRSTVYIANLVKCRPPQNRTPTDDEIAACAPYLNWQLGRIKPRFVVALGATAARSLISPDIRIRRDHGQWRDVDGIQMMPTFHPSAMLRDAAQKRLAWADFLSIKQQLEGE